MICTNIFEITSQTRFSAHGAVSLILPVIIPWEKSVIVLFLEKGAITFCASRVWKPTEAWAETQNPFQGFPYDCCFTGDCISNPSPPLLNRLLESWLEGTCRLQTLCSRAQWAERPWTQQPLSSETAGAASPRTLCHWFHISFVYHTGLGFFFSSKNFILNSKRYKARPKSLPVSRKQNPDVTKVSTQVFHQPVSCFQRINPQPCSPVGGSKVVPDSVGGTRSFQLSKYSFYFLVILKNDILTPVTRVISDPCWYFCFIYFIIKVERIRELWCNLSNTLPRLQETGSEEKCLRISALFVDFLI